MATPLKEMLARKASGATELPFDPTGRDEPQMVSLPLERIEPDPEQPRKDLGSVSDLALSIHENGLLNPLIVEGIEGGRYRLLAGERRFAACRSLGLKTVVCIVRTVAEQSRLVLQLVENLHRKDLHPIEKAKAFQRLMIEFNLTQKDLAHRLGMSPSSINEALRVLELGPEVLDNLRTSEHVSKSVLLEIAKEPDAMRQKELCAEAVRGDLTVRKARNDKLGKQSPKRAQSAYVIPLEEACVRIQFKAGEVTDDRVRGILKAALLHLAGSSPAAGQ